MVGPPARASCAATLPYVDVWNTWYDWYGNTAEGFGANGPGDRRRVRTRGRDPATLERSACVLVRLGDIGVERPAEPEVTPLSGSLDAIAHGMRAMATPAPTR